MTPKRFAKLKAVLDRRQPDLCVLAEDVHKSHNIAAILRTCDAVGAAALHAVSPGGEFRQHHMIAGGARKWVRSQVHEDIEGAISTLKGSGFQIVAAHFSDVASDYRSWDYTRPTALLLGAERMGVSARAAALADQHLSIPMRGHVESLNVSVAAALILYEAARQREAAGLYESSRIDPLVYRDTLFEWCYPVIARHYRERNIPYPMLDNEGFIITGKERPALSAALQAARLRRRTARRTSDAES